MLEPRSSRRLLLAAAAVGVLALTGCGPTAPPAAPPPAPAPPVPPPGLSITVTSAPGTKFLVDNAGRTLYLFGLDSADRSACAGSCAVAWPPLDGTAQLGIGVTGTLTTLTRADGLTQAVYNGHPLYYFKNDTVPGKTSGEGLNAAGGVWYVLDPNGNQINTLDVSAFDRGLGMGGGY